MSKGAAEIEGGSGVSDEVLDAQRREQEKVDLDQQQAPLSDQFAYLWRESSVTGALVDYLVAGVEYDVFWEAKYNEGAGGEVAGCAAQVLRSIRITEMKRSQ